MTANQFGGFWTQDKLNVLREYLQFYCIAMSRQKFTLVYIDAFAGTGRCAVKDGEGGENIIDGSAKIALDCEPGFDRYRFIESKREHQVELHDLIDRHRNGHKASLARHTAEDMLPPILQGYDWKTHRGVLFLDPFGLQCSYQLLQQIAATQALDVFFLVSLSGLYRQAAVNEVNIQAGQAAILSSFLGTEEWRDAMYTEPPQDDLFDKPSRKRERGYEGMLQFTTNRLKALFPYVGEPNLLGTANGAPLFAFYFAVSNPSKAAVGLATRVSKEILSKLAR